MVHSVNANDDVPDFAGDEPELTNILYTHFESIGVVFANRINQMVLTEIEKDLTPVDAKMFNEDVEIKAKRKLPKVPVVVDRYFRVRASNVAGKITKTTQKEARRVLAAVRKLHDKGAKVGVVPVNLASTSGRMFRTTLNGRASGIVRMNTNGPAEAVKLTQVQLLRGEEPSLSGAGTTSKGTKRWSNMADSLVRGPTTGSQFNHQRANQTVKINEPFIVSGEQLRFPGDESLGASLGNVINCRCAVSYNIKEVAKKVKKHAKNLRSSPSVAIEDLTGQAVVRGTGPFAIADDVPLNSIMNVQGKIDPEYLMELERSWAALPPEVRQLCKETNLKIRVGETLESLLGQNLDTQLGAYAVDKGEIYLGNYVTHNGTRSAILDRASDTLRHEIGHHIDYTLRDYLGLRGSKAKKFKEAWQAARVANAGDDGLNYYFTHSSLDRNMEESFAEAFRSAFNPSKPGKIGFSKNAQGFYFDKNMKDVVEVVRAQIDDYIQMRTRGSLIKSPLTGIVTKPKVVPTKTVKATLPKASESPQFQIDNLISRELVDEANIKQLDDYVITIGENPLVKSGALDEDELVEIIDEYVVSSTEINGALRGTVPRSESVSHQIEMIDEVISNAKTNRKLTVFRGISEEAIEKINPKIGMEFVDDAFNSWTADRSIAADFSRVVDKNKPDTYGAVMRMKLPKGSKGVFISEGEYEMLLPRNLRYRIVDIEDNIPIRLHHITKEPIRSRVITVEPIRLNTTKPKLLFAPTAQVDHFGGLEKNLIDNVKLIALKGKQKVKKAFGAIKDFIFDDYNKLNKALRAGTATLAEIDKVNLVSEAIELGGGLKKDVSLYRGVTISNPESQFLANLSKGDVFEERGFSAWTTLTDGSSGKTIAEKATSAVEYARGNTGVVFKVTAKEGTKGIVVNKAGTNVLLDRRLKFKVVDDFNMKFTDKTGKPVIKRMVTVEITKADATVGTISKVAKPAPGFVSPKKVVSKVVKETPKPKVVGSIKTVLPKASESPDFAMKTLNKRLTAKKMEALDDYETYLRNKAGLKESELLNAIDGLEEYIGDSENINSVLRTGHLFEDRGLSVAQVKKQIKAIDKAISLGVTAEDTVVYRGLSGHAARIVNPKVGMEFVDDAIGSWSGERVTAANFMRRTEYGISKIDPDAVMFRMKLKKGSNSLFLDADEAEFLLPRGTKYRIVEIEDNVPVMRKTSFKKGQSPSVNRRVATVEIIPEGEVASPVTKLAKKKVVKKKAAVKKKVAKRKRPLNDATSPKVKATLPKASESPDFDVINIESQFSPNDSIIARLKPFDEVLPAKQRAATIDAIDNYVTDSDFINSYLRTGKEITLDPGDIVPTVAEIKNSVKLIDTAISGAKVQEDITVYRGITSSSVARINPKIGMEFSDKGFGSWSGHRELAAEFMGKTTDTKTAIIRMRLNKGDKALFLNTDESEFLLPRNMRYKILDIEENVAVDVIDDIIKRRVITVEPIF